jgi:hemoglobin-like flavoprotein
MSDADAALMEASLTAVADAGIDIRHTLFERFFTAYPERRASFISVDAASRRMTDETLQMMFGLAGAEEWVWPLVAELVFTHRSYGALPIAEYDAFIDMTVAELGLAAGPAWSVPVAAAWQRQADALKAMIRKARDEWASVMPAGAPQVAWRLAGV